jgi:hypothetical protein
MSAANNPKISMSAESEDKLENNLERDDMGEIDDWVARLGLEILKIKHKIDQAKVGGADPDTQAVIDMLNRRLLVYKSAIKLLEDHPEFAYTIAGSGGVRAIIAYITKKAKEKAAEDKMAGVINAVRKQLPSERASKLHKKSGFAAGAAGQVTAQEYEDAL